MFTYIRDVFTNIQIKTIYTITLNKCTEILNKVYDIIYNKNDSITTSWYSLLSELKTTEFVHLVEEKEEQKEEDNND